ncbi:hypothetical protein KKA69_03975 [Patescibacteria group bacterium]|nr:hypothetical protein [Patescibacteria group bacterium]
MKVEEGMIKIELSVDCYYCNNRFKFESAGKGEVFLVKCDLCGKLQLNVYCEKCGIGGFIIPEGGSFSMGKVDDFSKKPVFWTCNDCHNRWPIPAGLFDQAPVLAKSILSPEEQERVKKEIQENGLQKKQKGPKFWVIFLITLIAGLIGQPVKEIVPVLFVIWIFKSFLNKKARRLAFLAVFLGLLIGVIAKMSIWEK